MDKAKRLFSACLIVALGATLAACAPAPADRAMPSLLPGFQINALIDAANSPSPMEADGWAEMIDNEPASAFEARADALRARAEILRRPVIPEEDMTRLAQLRPGS